MLLTISQDSTNSVSGWRSFDWARRRIASSLRCWVTLATNTQQYLSHREIEVALALAVFMALHCSGNHKNGF
jgi:hypothetical protein